MKRILIGLMVLGSLSQLHAQDQNPAPRMALTVRTALTRLTNQIRSFPQEKIYLQTDKPYYSAGDRLWFRIHMVHASLHTPFLMSRYVYVELINAHNEVLIRKKIRPDEAARYYGQIDLAPELAAGWYSIRAYTNYMRNLDEAYFYRQKIYIGNALKGASGVEVDESTTSDRSGGKITQKESDNPFDMQFFPEGGALIAGNMQTIGFKALGKNGLGTNVRGTIVDETGTEYSNFTSTHLGMGKLMLMPVSGKKYKAICEDDHGQKLTVLLPAVSDSACALSVQQNSELVSVNVLVPNKGVHTDTLFIIGTLRGIPLFQATLEPGNNSFTFSKEGMFSGVTQILLLNNKGAIISERLMFVYGKDFASLELKPDKTNYQKRDAVHAVLTLKDSKGKPLEGSFSVSITDDNDVRIDSTARTISSYLLLESDLKGNIEQPNTYFNPKNKLAQNQMDLLMMTQGWKRYNVAASIAGQYDRADGFEVERGPVLRGKVQNFPARRGLPNNNVSILLGMRFPDAVTTNSSGRFEYLSPEFPDSTKIRIDATKKEGQFVELVIYPDTFPNVNVSCVFPDDLRQDNIMKSYLKKSRDKYTLENGMMTVNLDKVVITGKREDKQKKLRQDRGSYIMNPSYTLNEEDIEICSTVWEALMRAPGVMLNNTNDGVLIRNQTPLIIVDNMRWEMQDLTTLNVSEIKMIDIVKDPGDAMMFGSGSQNGVIYIYLKRGEDRRDEPVVLGRHQTIITPLGYAMPAEFYVPKYQVTATRQDPLPDLRTTIFWKPCVQSDSTGTADLFFFTADGAGTYTVTAEGVSPLGEIIRYQGKLNRK